jgi:hypothetical protein
MGKQYNKVLKCVVSNCKFNSICHGCTGLTSQHLRSNIECKQNAKNWTSIPHDFKLKFKKICIKELKEQEIIQICPDHVLFYQLINENNELIPNIEANLDAFSNFVDNLDKILIQYQECNEYSFEFVIFIIKYIENMEISLINQEKPITLLFMKMLKIINLSYVKNISLKEMISNDEIFIEKLWNILNKENLSELNIYVLQILFLFSNLILFKTQKKSFLDKIYYFCLENIDKEDNELKYQIFSIIWAIAYEDEYKIKLKNDKKLYFFSFFNENYKIFDIKMHELLIGFFFFIYLEEIEEFLEHPNIGKMEIMEFVDNVYNIQSVYSDRLKFLFDNHKLFKLKGKI